MKTLFSVGLAKLYCANRIRGSVVCGRLNGCFLFLFHKEGKVVSNSIPRYSVIDIVIESQIGV